MSLLDVYNKASSTAMKAVKAIPQQAVHFFDLQNKVDSGGFRVYPPGTTDWPKTTQFTTTAQSYYDVERKNMVVPEGMDPSTLDRYNQSNPYYNPGQIPSE